jgi:Ca2+-binding EF-hand superfamily protein
LLVLTLFATCRSGNGTISYVEFVNAAYLPRRGAGRQDIVDVLDDELTQLIWEASRSEVELMRLFRKFDRRGTGRIARRDFASAVNKLGLRDATPSQIDALMDRIDINGDGLLDYAEFVDAALVGSKSRGGTGGSRGSPRARRWGRSNGRSLSPSRRVGGGFDYEASKTRGAKKYGSRGISRRSTPRGRDDDGRYD